MITEISKSSSDAITRAYLDSLLLEVRHLDSCMPDTSVEIFGRRFSAPIMTGALSHLNKQRENGMAEYARGAALADMISFSGMGGDDEIAAMTATGASVIKIVKPYADRAEVVRRLRFAESCGCLAVGMDIDHAFAYGNDKYDEIDGMAMFPVTTDELRGFVESVNVPFVVKGVLSRHDARRCLEAGVSGIVISHHNGRLNYAVPPLMILPEIIDEVGGKMKIFVDCAIQSGTDVLKALALGADACCVGRPLMQPLRENGAEGVAEHLRGIQRELTYAMAMTCSPDISKIDPSIVHKTTFTW